MSRRSKWKRLLGSDTVDALAKEVGMSRQELVQQLSAELPHTVDKLTPKAVCNAREEATQSSE